MSLKEDIFLDRAKLDRYIGLMASRIGAVPDEISEELVPLTFLNAVHPLNIYEMPRYADREVILRRLKFKRIGVLAPAQVLTRVEKLTFGSAKGLDEKEVDTVTVEDQFLHKEEPVAQWLKQVIVR